MWKCAGAKAAKGGTLDEVISAAQKAIDHCRSVGIGLKDCVEDLRSVPTASAMRLSDARWFGRHGGAAVGLYTDVGARHLQ